MSKTNDNVKLFYILMGLTVFFVLFGIIMVFSASHVSAFRNYHDSLYYLKRQAAWGAIGLIAMYLFSKYDYHRLQKRAGIWLIAAIILLALLFVPGLGKVAGGARRWLVLGPVPIQPSEFAKLAIIIYVADLFNRKRMVIHEFKHLAIPFLPILLLLCGLVMAQPDLGTAMIICAVGLTAAFIAGARFRHMFSIVSIGTLIVALLIFTEDYRRERFLAFLNPWADPQGSGFHIIQSLIAFGSGGYTGLGLGMSRQKFFYLPAAHTDFVFAIIGEELGAVGSIALIFFLIVFVSIGFMIARRAPDVFGRTLAFSIVTLIAGQAIFNMAAVTGMIPVTGIPLPFISAGGSSLLMILSAIGILLNIALAKKRSVVVKKQKSNNQRRRDSRPRLSRNSSSRSLRAVH